MKRNILMTGLCAVLMLVVLGACSKVPQEQLTAAQTAIEAAKQAEAQRYMPENFNAVMDSMNSAMAEIEAQNAKFFMSRSYEKANRQLSQAMEMANNMTQETEAMKARFQSDVAELTDFLKTEIQETRDLIAQAPKGKEGKAALQAMEAELVDLENSLIQVTTLVDSGDFLAAYDKLTAGKQKVLEIQNELNVAIAKHSGSGKVNRNASLN